MSIKEKSIEIEEKSIDAAIEAACREFGMPREKLNIEIISEGNVGFWGMLSKKAKIRASLLSLDVSFELDGNNKPPANNETAAPLKIEAKIIPAMQESQTVLQPASSSPVGYKAKEVLEGILKRMSFDCRVSLRETQEKIILSIEGEGSGLLIGKRGQNLDAIQYVLNKAINRSDMERKIITVDSEAYRTRREESLLSLAEKIREKVKKTKKPVSLSNMNAHDRRIIHMALQEDEALITKSRGEGEYRKIVILPARRSHIQTRKKESEFRSQN